jgi:hypothetical protein
MDGEAIYRTGLLYYVNSTVLWPLGLALAVEKRKDGTGYRQKLSVIELETPENIVDNAPLSTDHPRYRAARYIMDRLAAMTDAERALSIEILSDPDNVRAFLTPEPDAARISRPKADDADDS